MELATREGEAAAAPPRSAPCSRPSSAPPSSSTVKAQGATAPRARENSEANFQIPNARSFTRIFFFKKESNSNVGTIRIFFLI